MEPQREAPTESVSELYIIPDIIFLPHEVNYLQSAPVPPALKQTNFLNREG